MKSWNDHISVSTEQECSYKLLSLQWHTFNMYLKSIFQGIFRLHMPYHWVTLCRWTQDTLIANSEFTTRYLVACLFLDDLKCRYNLQRDGKPQCLPGAQSLDLLPCACLLRAGILGILKAGAERSVALGWLCSLWTCWNKREAAAAQQQWIKNKPI